MAYWPIIIFALAGGMALFGLLIYALMVMMRIRGIWVKQGKLPTLLSPNPMNALKATSAQKPGGVEQDMRRLTTRLACAFGGLFILLPVFVWGLFTLLNMCVAPTTYTRTNDNGTFQVACLVQDDGSYRRTLIPQDDS